MALTAYGKNEALKGATSLIKYVGLFGFTTGSEPKYALTSNTAIGGTLFNLTGAKAKGFTNNAIVFVRAVTASVTNPVVARPYWVVGETTNGFELAVEEGGTAIKVVGAEVTTATEVFLATELTGGSYARVATAWGTAKAGEIADTAAEVVKVPAGKTVTDAGWWEKSSGGSGAAGLQAAAKLEVPEAYGAEGEYKVTSDKLEANPVA
jgi:hypothetical protein